jgi:hypothetical protein
MTIETALEWSRLWWLLSLDLAAEFRSELWLDRLSDGSLDYVRSGLDVAADLPSYGSDPRPKVYERLDGYAGKFGRESLDHLLWWKRCVFINGASDRASEFVWRMAAYSGASLSDDSAIVSAFEVVRQDCSTYDRRNEEKARDLRVSKWDQQAIAAEESSPQEALGFIKAIASSNGFVRSWHSNVTVKGRGFLSEVFAVVSAIPPSPELQFDPETLPFPSSWEIDLRSNGTL